MGSSGNITRRRFTGTAAALGGALASACGASGGSGGDAGAAAKNAAPITVQWMTDWNDEGSRGQVIKGSVAAYKERKPNVTVDVRHPAIGSSATGSAAVVAHFAAGTIAEVVLPSSSVVHALMDQNVLMDITSRLKRLKFDKESVWWEAQYVENKGKTHGMPYQMSIASWVYNKTWFTRENVRPPTDAWTTDDLLEASRRLTRAEEGKYGIQMKQEWQWWYAWMFANGADYVSSTTPLKTTLDDPKVTQVLTSVVDMIHRHRLAAPEYGANKVASANFTKGEIAMTSNGKPKQMNATIKGEFEWDIMLTPRWAANKKRVTTWNQQPHIVTKFAEERGVADAAVDLAVWLCGEEAQNFVAREGGSTPVNKKSAFGPVHLDGNPPGLKLIMDQMLTKPDQSARGYRLWSGYSTWLSAVNPILNQAFAGEISVQEAVTRATTAGDAAIRSSGQ